MRFSKRILWKAALAGLIAIGLAAGVAAQKQIVPPGDGGGPLLEPPMSAKAIIGQNIFFDTALSSPKGQACASCHDADHGWADARNALDPQNGPVPEGAVTGRFGPRNGQSLAYADYSPDLVCDGFGQHCIGGWYRDGRVKKHIDQAQNPFLSRTEMNNPNLHAVVKEVQRSSYAPLFEKVYGQDVWSDPQRAFDGVSESLVAFQNSRLLNRFTSRYDRYLDGDLAILTPQEKAGLALFEGKGGCAACHLSRPNFDRSKPLFTTFTYENIGVPKNPKNPFYGQPPSINPEGVNFVDRGLGGATGVASEVGKFKIPSLRNVALSAPYTHNGFFTNLYDVVQFHNTRDTDSRWGPPEIPQNLSTGPGRVRAAVSIDSPTLPPDPGDPPGIAPQLGHLGLGDQEVAQILAFLNTLNEGPTPAP
jgi:cytochrome c peroxidase